jgi:peptide chain release factor 1
MDLRPHIEKFSRRFAEVEAALSDPRLSTIRNAPRSWQGIRPVERTGDGGRRLWQLAHLHENRSLLKTEPPDSEMAALAKEEIARLEADEKRLARELECGLIPPNPTDSRNTIVEIRAGAGGSESALFAADLYRMYSRYAEGRGWKVETLDSSSSDLGGFKEIIFQINGTEFRPQIRAACIASSAFRRPKRKAASTPAPRPWPCCRRPRKWTSRSSPTRSKSTAAAPPARAVKA